jgi:4-hydroxy-3-methylbut-2-en-1-yl diphosphate reductase
MRVLRARHLGMCFGVRDAIALAVRESASRPLTVLGELVHNETVLDDLRSRGIRFCGAVDEVETAGVMITAHGASERRLATVRDRGLRVLDATCFLVRTAHGAVMTMAREGFHPVIVGRRDHVEVRGLTEDLDEFDVVLDDEDVRGLTPRTRFGVIAQTTQPAERVQRLASLMRLRFPEAEVRVVDTVCAPTKRRQEAALELARRADVVIVIGGARSNNTRELVDTCRVHCARVFHVQTAADLRAEWLAGVHVVGLTAGTSTPDRIIDDVEARLREIAGSRLAA